MDLTLSSAHRELEELIRKLNQSGEETEKETKLQNAVHGSDDSESDTNGEPVPKPESKKPIARLKEHTPKVEQMLQHQLESLCLDYPEFARDVIQSLMEDQGNDTEEVISYLEVNHSYYPSAV